MKKTCMPTIAGALNIIAGLFGLLIAFGMTIASFFIGGALDWAGVYQWMPPVNMILGLMAVPLALVSALAIVGGIFALQRRVWGLSLAGSIAALIIPCYLLGLSSIILIALAKREFVAVPETVTVQPPLKTV